MDAPTLMVFNDVLEDQRCEQAFRIAIGQRSASGIPQPDFFQPNWRYSLAGEKRQTYTRYSLYIKFGRKKGDSSIRVGHFCIGTPPPGVEGVPWKSAPTLPRTSQSSTARKEKSLTVNSLYDKRAPKRQVAIMVDSTGMPYPVDKLVPNCTTELNLGKRARPI